MNRPSSSEAEHCLYTAKVEVSESSSGTKKCQLCKEEKAVTDFHKNKSKPGGLQVSCKPCAIAARMRSYYKDPSVQRAHSARSRSELAGRILQVLKHSACMDCGEKDPVVLDFDHVLPGKYKAISAMARNGYAWSRIQAEMSLCEVVCANCHRRRTAKRANWKKLY